jgi:hypothetical protein
MHGGRPAREATDDLLRDFLPRARLRPAGEGEELGDLRFRRLLGPEAWDALPAAVRARFGRRLRAGASATYDGVILEHRMSRCGWLLAQVCRLIGAPLPLDRTQGTAAVVGVTEYDGGEGQAWTRVYVRRSGFPQVIHSAKRFAGPTGLEEYLGAGFGVALSVAAIAQGIRFASAHYFVLFAGRRLRIPAALAPGMLEIEHRDIGCGQFLFTLRLVHPLLGELMHQTGLFRDRG